MSERLKIRGSLARKALKEMEDKNLIRCVVSHRSQMIYTRVISEADEEEEKKNEKEKEENDAKAKK